MYRRIAATLLTLVSLLLISPAWAAEKWVHTRGSVEHLDGGRWVERARTQGEDAEFHFNETQRGDGFIEMYDASRDCHVRLFDNRLEFRCPREGRHEYAVCYHGSWAVDRLHITLVIDTQAAVNRGAGDIRGYVTRCYEHLSQVIKEAMEGNPALFKDRISMTVLMEDEVTPDQIRAVYRAGGPAASATGQLFYYAGHGAFDTEKGRYLYTSGGDITLTEIRNILNGTRARSIVMLTESCGDFFTFEPPARRTPASWKVFYRLFFENAGIVEINSSTAGESSWGDDEEGGMFTRTLCKYLCEPASGVRPDGVSGEVTWDDFFLRLRDDTSALFARTRQGVEAYLAEHPEIDRTSVPILKSDSQTPFAKSLGNWSAQQTRRVTLVNQGPEAICVWLRFYDRNFETEEWGWYPLDGTPLVYEVAPGATITPLMDGFPIEASAVQVWGNSPSGARWGDRNQVLMATEAAYIGPLEARPFRFGAQR